MVECKDGSILAFYPNGSALFPESFPGHNMYGCVEYRRSKDRGLTWDKPKVLQYSYDTFIGDVNKVGCEKAVVYNDGTIVLFCHRSIGQYFEPYDIPVCLLSYDNGLTWSDSVLMGNERGRIYDNSNNIVIKGADGISRMLVQYSETYYNDTGKFTIMLAWVECE